MRSVGPTRRHRRLAWPPNRPATASCRRDALDAFATRLEPAASTALLELRKDLVQCL